MGHFRDRRLFKRYKQKAELIVTFEGGYYKASTVDFSLSGLCICIEGTPPISQNSPVSLNIEELDLDIDATAVWVQKTDSNVLVGLRKMSITGLLRHYPLSDVLLDLQRSDATGTLEIRDGSVCKQIFVKDGTIVFASSNYREDRIEEMLLKEGVITGDQYYQVVHSSERTGKSQSRVLVEMGYVKPRDVLIAVRRQCEDIVLSLFAWENGRVTYIEGPLPEGIPSLKLSAANLIFNGIKRIQRPEYFRSICPPMDTILFYSEDPMNLFQDIRFTRKDQHVLSLIDSKITLKEILAASTEGEVATLKVVCALLCTRMIVPIGEGSIPDKSIVKMIREPRKASDPGFAGKVEDMFSRLGSTDYYTILGVDRRASQEEIKKAFYRCAREFHPDRHFAAGSDEALKKKLNTIFAAINDANRVLSNTVERGRYDDNLSVRPCGSQAEGSEMARGKFREGKDAFREGHYEDAAVLFGQAAYLDCSAAEYHFYLGAAYARLNKFHDAERSISEALRMEPKNADYTAELGHLYLRLGFKSRAKGTFEKAIRLEPSNRRAREGLDAVCSMKSEP